MKLNHNNILTAMILFVRRTSLYQVFLLLFIFPQISLAENNLDDWLPESVQIHGFLSQGFVHTSDNNFSGRSDDNISIDFRELGINGSWQVNPDLRVAMQILWRDQGELDEDRLRIDYALVDYSFYSSENLLFGIKAGRVPNPLGFYNDTRDVAATRPSIFLPQSIYFDRTRNLSLSSDGGYFYGEFRNEMLGNFYLTAGGLQVRVDDAHFEKGALGNFSGAITGDLSFLTRLLYEWQDGKVRFGITYVDINVDYESRNNVLSSGYLTFNPIVFSAQYNSENWSLTGEYAIRRTKTDEFGVIPDDDVTGESYYLQGTYQFTSYLEGLVRYDRYIADRNDRNGKKMARKYNVANYSRFAKDWTVGLRLKPYDGVLISAEYHRINGTGWTSPLENKASSLPMSQYWDLYSLMISYNF